VLARRFDLRVDDGATPAVERVTSPAPDGFYPPGVLLFIQVEFSEPVIVTGRPLLRLETGATDRTAEFLFGSGTRSLTFRYPVVSGDSSPDLDVLSPAALSLNGGTIRDAVGTDALLTLPVGEDPHSLPSNKNLRIVTPLPTPFIDIGLRILRATDTGVAGDSITAIAQPTLTGEAPAGFTLTLYADAVPVGQTVVAADGTFTVQPQQPLPDGDVFLQVSLTGPAGEASVLSPGVTITIDTTAEPPSTPVLAAESNTGNPNDTITRDTTPTFVGQAEPDSDVFLFVDGSINGAATVGADGSYTVTVEDALPGGVHSIQARIVDLADNVSELSDALTIEIVGAAAPAGPRVLRVEARTADGQYTVGDQIEIDVVFDAEVVVRGAPKLLLETGERDRRAPHRPRPSGRSSPPAGRPSATVTFLYVVRPGDANTDLDYVHENALTVVGGIIRGADDGAPANLRLAEPGDDGSLSANAEIAVGPGNG